MRPLWNMIDIAGEARLYGQMAISYYRLFGWISYGNERWCFFFWE